MNLPIHDLNVKMLDDISLVHPITVSSNIINVQEMGCFSIHIIADGSTSVNGALTIEISNDGKHFVTDASYAVGSTSVQYMHKADKVGYAHVKATYASSAGSAGKLNCIFNGKKI